MVEELESLIRSGQFEEAEKHLSKIGKIDRKDAVVIANIARRVNRLNLAAKILNPIVRSSDKTQKPATALEKIEYADTLRQLGAVDEAWQLLHEVDADQYPQALAHKGYCLINQWRYEEALGLLQKYVLSEKLTSYERTVGQINLSAVLIQVGELDQAEELLSRLREETRAAGLLLLYGNSLELGAQILILKEEYDLAVLLLKESSEVLKRAGKVVGLYVQKWEAIAKSLKAKQTTPELREVFMKAQTTGHWETMRDCDLYMGCLDRDQSRLTRLYFGTPYKSFRQRISRVSKNPFEIPKSYFWCRSSEAMFTLNLSSGEVSGQKKAQLPLGQAIHRFLILLSQDFYKPLSLMSAFGRLFPNEFMNATTSANRVHQIVKRCREWIEEVGLPLQIEEIEGAYRLVLGQGMGLLVPAEPLSLAKEEFELLVLEKHLGFKPFNVHQASEILTCSDSKSRILFRWAVEKGRVQKLGKGPSLCYQLLPPPY